MKKKILVIGSLNIDMVMNVHHMPAVGETILCDKMELIPGGKGANQACAAGKLGADVDVVMLGAVGKDAYGRMQKESLRSAGVDVTRIIEKENVSTGMAVISVNQEGNNSITVIQGANKELSVKDMEDNIDLLENSDIIIFQLEVPMETILYAAKKGRELGKYLILDPAPAPEDCPEELFGYMDIVKPNETELSLLTGVEHAEEHLEEAAGMLKKMGAKNVIVTLGGKGVYICPESGTQIQLEARKVDVVDTTAAGDSFTAAMAVELAGGKDLQEACAFANLAASVIVTRKGAQSSIPTREEVEEIAGKRQD